MTLFMRLKPRQWKNLRKLIHSRVCYSTGNEYIYESTANDYSEVPQYPPIEDISDEAREMRAWHDKIKRQKTVEEKLFEINVPRYWGWKCLLLKEGEIPYNSLGFVKSVTRTHVVETNELPKIYSNTSEKSFHLANEIRQEVEDVIIDNYANIRHKLTLESSEEVDKGREFTSAIVNDLNRLMLKFLRNENKNLSTIQTDYSPRIEAFWNQGSLTETYVPEEYPYGMKEKMPEEYLERPTDKYIQYIGKPLIQLRSANPLSPIIPHYAGDFFEYFVGHYQYDPVVVLGFEMARRHVTNIPGFWPGEPREFSFLSYHDVSQLNHRPATYGQHDLPESIQYQAILASFSWLMALSSYQGFTTFHDVTYPFVTQTVLTDGQYFSFATYQLNTTELYHPNHLHNPRCNMCWITPRIKLYNIVQGEVKDVNIEVIKMLIQMYLTQTEALEKCERKPYLGKDIRTISDYEDEEKRCWLEENFKYFSSNRPRHRVDKMYEPLDYEKIFKMQFVKIIRDARKRPFERKEEPYWRKMSDHPGEYIPRGLRPDAHLPKYKQRKFRKTFYPE